MPILEIKDLETHFQTPDGVVKAVNKVSYTVEEGEFVGVVGESGCGKSVSALSIMGLVPSPPGEVVGGQVLFDGQDLLQLTEDEMRRVRGNRIGMVFQEPMTFLNPVLTIGRQITELLELHLGMTKKQAWARAGELLGLVGIPDVEQRLKSYPHQLSGGMRQRVMIAMAISCAPKLVIADEPTTALDVTIQAQILELMQRLSEELGTAMIIITHNLGVVARYAMKVVVMYAGRVIESGTSRDIYENPRHPYTLGLLSSVPRVDAEIGSRLDPIHGLPPDLIDLPPGCSFAPRCRFMIDKCLEETPDLLNVGDSHESRCWRAEDLADLASTGTR